MNDFELPRKLGKGDDRASFTSGASELDDWFRRFAYENQRANNATTYVTTDGESVCGYYSITVSAVEKTQVHEKFDKPSDPKQLPCILLARLAVSERHQGKSLGRGLFVDSLKRAATLSDSVGARALLIHARDEEARSFYEHHSETFAMPGNGLHLMIPMKWIRANFLVQ
ncbi:GNAT family N-acetyltransferase [Arthrobacter rhombi]|uniref:GNAT family N-acetyltransferase n=1 Tax=Arthrobacter rhombi TaxID=71253 RepID=UPI003FD40C02